ncbi:MAG TPA: hypothetical protein VGW57_15360 [Chthoniobacterales bacterium]|nr:hypothetical protein [Chthoniobacterales bacterium]
MQITMLSGIATNFDSILQQAAKIRDALNALYTLRNLSSPIPPQFGEVVILYPKRGPTTLGFLEYSIAGRQPKRGCGFAYTSSTTFVALELESNGCSEKDFLETLKALMELETW